MTSDNEYSDSTDTTTTLEGFVFFLILLPSLTTKNSTQWSEPSIKSRCRSLVMSFSAATVVQQYLTSNGNTLPWSHLVFGL